MKKQKIKILLAGLICFSHVIGFSVVICHGSNGHVALEFIGDMCCDHLEAHSDSPSTSLKEAFSSSEHGCGPCVDTPITAEAIEVVKRTNPIKSTIASLPAILTSTIRGYNFFGYQLASKLFASVNPCLTSLRTVILLA